MPKIQNKTNKQVSKTSQATQQVIPLPSIFGLSYNSKVLILALIAFLFYAITLFNQFALDDGIVIIHNDYVQQGFAGIGKIMTNDAYQSYYDSMHAGEQLSGGRYRPLSEVFFAIEHQLFGESWFVMHLASVIFYVLCVVSIFYFLNHFLFKRMPRGEDMAFFASLLFAIHPMHTEVVANVKSSDEILSLLFIMLTLICSLQYLDTKKIIFLGGGLLFFFLALLAKEYAFMLFFLIPLLFYLYRGQGGVNVKSGREITGTNSNLSLLLNILPYYGVIVIYLIVRFQAVEMPVLESKVPHSLIGLFNGLHLKYMNPNGYATKEILDNPYLLATPSQKRASEFFILGKYLWMLFIPYPLSSDYSFAQIPYHSFSDSIVWLIVLIYMASTIWGIVLLRKKNILAFPVFFYLLNLLLVSNFAMDIGATMGERLAFHSSFGFTVILTFYLFKWLDKFSKKTMWTVLTAGGCLLIVVCGAETVVRDFQWRNDVVLFLHDVDVVPNSVMVNGNAGARYIDLSEKEKDSVKSRHYMDKAIYYLRKSITLHPGYVNSYLNIGVAYYKLRMPDTAKYYWDIARKYYPHHPSLAQYYPLLANLYMNVGLEEGKKGNIPQAINLMEKGLANDSTNAILWDNLGGASFSIGRYDIANYAWIKTLKLDPANADAAKGMAALEKMRQQ